MCRAAQVYGIKDKNKNNWCTTDGQLAVDIRRIIEHGSSWAHTEAVRLQEAQESIIVSLDRAFVQQYPMVQSLMRNVYTIVKNNQVRTLKPVRQGQGGRSGCIYAEDGGPVKLCLVLVPVAARAAALVPVAARVTSKSACHSRR